MGTWGTGISSNDTFADVYDEFFGLYNDGGDPAEISTRLIAENRETIEDSDDCNNFWFALALAQWECKQLDPGVLETVRLIVESGKDIEVWRELGADAKDIPKRRKVLDAFLAKLLSEKPKARAKKKPKKGIPIFEKGICLTFRLSNGNYGGAVVLAADAFEGGASNLLAVTRINQPTIPTEKEFKNAEILIRTYDNGTEKEMVLWIFSQGFKDEKELFDIAGRIAVPKDFMEIKYKYSFGGGWKYSIIDVIDTQLENEKFYNPPREYTKISKYIKKPWRLW